ncbi:type I-C CRISPR-associated protein Cas8c/Csd1 [Desulfocurvibacter africanus]|uniref:type I-C CRISPR-associated protein Cas8c/Csd1 n=1 Tax=Desulfocurvibacter africanus TaxID=873 RepID=UPI002FDAD8FA
MSWIQKLYETHGAVETLTRDKGSKSTVPVSHTTARVHIEIVLDAEGIFQRARVLDKSEVTTVIPCTEASGTRSGIKPDPHPLCDSLQYVARDYRDYGGEVTKGFKDEPLEPHASYLKQLQTWVEASPHPKTKAILKYVQLGCIIKNLTNEHVLPLDHQGKFVKTKEKNAKDSHQIWPVLSASQLPENAVIRWRVEIPGQMASGVWEDQSLIDNWATYYPAAITRKDVCLVLGEENTALASFHPAKLRHAADKAKLISANDSSGFTFRGRFTDKDGAQACGVGYEVTQKAHSALRWLIERQGYRNGSQVYVSWAVSGKDIPPPLGDGPDWLEEEAPLPSHANDGLFQTLNQSRNLGQNFALKLKSYLAGYQKTLSPTEEIVVMGVDSATPGRMSIIYYREILGSDLLDRLHKWHWEMAWPQRHVIEIEGKTAGKKDKKRVVWRTCAPAPRVIVEAAYGPAATRDKDKKLARATIERILPCIVDGRALPRDLMESCVQRATNRDALKSWEWEQTLGVACALFKGYYLRHQNPDKRREYSMALEEECTSRDYLYGRLLAIAENIEGMALYVAGESRPTTAVRLMQRFADHPYSTWRTIELSLQPYMQRLQTRRAGFLHNMRSLLDKVLDLFEGEDFRNDRRLTGEFLLSYHCQRQDLREKTHKEDASETEGEA